MPIEDEPQFHAWIADAIRPLRSRPRYRHRGGPGPREPKAKPPTSRFKKYIIGLVEKAEKSPGPGMISQLVHDDGPDGRMSPSEIVNNTILLFVAGHDSTVNLISHCVLTVLRNPWSIELLRSRPELIPGAIEEVLRLQSSVQFFPTRSALADIEIAGTTIPRGSPIYLMYGCGQPRSAALPRSQHVRPPARRQRARGLGARHSHLLRRSAGPAGSQHRFRGFPSSRRKPAAGRGPAALPHQPGIPRPAASARRLRRDPALRRKALKTSAISQLCDSSQVRYRSADPGLCSVCTGQRGAAQAERPSAASLVRRAMTGLISA